MMRDKSEITLLAQGSLLEVKLSSVTRNASGGRKRAITDFSACSRRSLLKSFARTNYTGKSIFVTLTYGQEYPTPKQAKRHLDTLFKRVKRKFPKASGYWRLEFQKRGAVHFHIIFFNLPYWDKRDVKKAWAQVIGREYCDNGYRKPQYKRGGVRQHLRVNRVLGRSSAVMRYPSATRPPFTRIELVRSRRGAWSYVSKYIAKQGAHERGGSGFIYVSYLTVDGRYVHPQTGEIEEIGRYWGVFNREELPIAEVVSIVAGWSKEIGRKAFYDLRRAARKMYRKAGNFGGFYIFSSDSEKWFRYFLMLIENDIENMFSVTDQLTR